MPTDLTKRHKDLSIVHSVHWGINLTSKTPLPPCKTTFLGRFFVNTPPLTHTHTHKHTHTHLTFPQPKNWIFP